MKTVDSEMPEWVANSWASFLGESELRSPCGLYKTDLFPLQRRAEIERVAEILKKRSPFCVMEIGADKGGAFYHWMFSLPSVRKSICLEPRGTPYCDSFVNSFRNCEFLWINKGSLDSGVF